MKINKFDDLIRSKGFNVTSLSRKIGADRKTVSRWLNGIHKPSGTMILKLSKALKVSATTIIETFEKEI